MKSKVKVSRRWKRMRRDAKEAGTVAAPQQCDEPPRRLAPPAGGRHLVAVQPGADENVRLLSWTLAHVR